MFVFPDSSSQMTSQEQPLVFSDVTKFCCCNIVNLGHPSPASRPPTKRSRRGTKICETPTSPSAAVVEPSKAQDSENSLGVAANNAHLGSVTGDGRHIAESNSRQERGSNEGTQRSTICTSREARRTGGDSSESRLVRSDRGRSMPRDTIEGTAANNSPERTMASGPQHPCPSHDNHGIAGTQSTVPNAEPSLSVLGPAASVGPQNIFLQLVTPGMPIPLIQPEGLVSSDAETEISESLSMSPETQSRTDKGLRLIHLAFPHRGGSVDREGIESIRRVAQASCIPDSIQVELPNSQDIPTVGYGQHVPLMNTPPMTTEAPDIADLEETRTNQAHRTAGDSPLEELWERPFSRLHFFRNMRQDGGTGVGLLDNQLTCPVVIEDPEPSQNPLADDIVSSMAQSPIREPTDTQDFRSRFPSRTSATPATGDLNDVAPHIPMQATVDDITQPAIVSSHTAPTTHLRTSTTSVECHLPDTNTGAPLAAPIEQNSVLPRRGPPRSRGGQRVARDTVLATKQSGVARESTNTDPTLPSGPTHTTPAPSPLVQPSIGPQASGANARNPSDTTSTTPEATPIVVTGQTRSRQALSPGRLARVRHLDKLRKRVLRAKQKRNAQHAATGIGSGAFTLLEKEVLDLCGGEPQGESHKDLVAALSKIVPTELPCYRELKSVTAVEIEAICRRLAQIFSNAQAVLPTWTRRTVGRLLKARRTRTRRKVKRLMALRAHLLRGQPSPPMPPGVFQVEHDHFVQELLTEEFKKLSNTMTERSNNMILKKGCGNKTGAGGYERAKAHITKREGRPATLREVRKWKCVAERSYEAGPSRSAIAKRIIGARTHSDAGVESSDSDGSSESARASDSDESFDSEGASDSNRTLEQGGFSDSDSLSGSGRSTSYDSSSEDGIAEVHGLGNSGGLSRAGLDVMPAHWHHPIRGAGAFFDQYVEIFGVEPGDREVAVWEANGRPWLTRPT